MRVIAGRLRGRRVDAPKGAATRPTYDRVRESMFAIIGPRIEGATVLDLFAGSGVLGIESVSRGAASAVFVDSDARALAVVRRNIEALGIGGACSLRRGDAVRLIERGALGAGFDVVFVDPPYRSGLRAAVLARLGEPGALALEALVVVEHEAECELPRVFGTLELTRRERYGSTAVSFYSPTAVRRHEREAT